MVFPAPNLTVSSIPGMTICARLWLFLPAADAPLAFAPRVPSAAIDGSKLKAVSLCEAAKEPYRELPCDGKTSSSSESSSKVGSRIVFTSVLVPLPVMEAPNEKAVGVDTESFDEADSGGKDPRLKDSDREPSSRVCSPSAMRAFKGNLKEFGCGPSSVSKSRRRDRGAFIDSVVVRPEKAEYDDVAAVDRTSVGKAKIVTLRGIRDRSSCLPEFDRLIGPSPDSIPTSSRDVTVWYGADLSADDDSVW